MVHSNWFVPGKMGHADVGIATIIWGFRHAGKHVLLADWIHKNSSAANTTGEQTLQRHAKSHVVANDYQGYSMGFPSRR